MKRDVFLIANVSIFILISLIIFVILNYFFSRNFLKSSQKEYDNQILESNFLFYSLFSLLWIITNSFILYKFININLVFLKNNYNLIFIFLIFLLYFINKNSIIYIFLKVLNLEHEFILRNKNLFTFWKFISSLVLLSVNFLLPFNVSQNHLFVLSLIIFIVFELFEALHVILKLKNISFNWYYKILYLCILEILPILTFLKVLFGNKYL